MIFFVIFLILFAYLVVVLLNQVEKDWTKSDKSSRYYIDQFGYYRFQNSGKLLHRYIASKQLGRRLYKNEVVHHKDGNKRNNQPENLYVCLQSEHEAIHGIASSKFYPQ